jgi:hypothetical protein
MQPGSELPIVAHDAAHSLESLDRRASLADVHDALGRQRRLHVPVIQQPRRDGDSPFEILGQP